MRRAWALIAVLGISGCITGLSTQSFQYTVETFDRDTGLISKRETVTGKNRTLAGPTKASAVADRVLQIEVMEGLKKIFVDMGEQVEVQGGEITPEQIRAVAGMGISNGLSML